MIKLLKKIKNNFNILDYSYYLYHGTNIDAAVSIQCDGYIKPFTNDNNDKPVISFTNDFDNAIHYANLKGKKMVILRTSINNKNFKLSGNDKYDHGNEFVSYNPISIDDVQILVNSETWIPLKEWSFNKH